MTFRALLIGCLVAALPAVAQPPEPYSCENTPEHRQFDFWVGTWEVTDKAGETIYGNNTISRRALHPQALSAFNKSTHAGPQQCFFVHSRGDRDKEETGRWRGLGRGRGRGSGLRLLERSRAR